MLKFALIGCGRIAKRHAELLGGGQLPFARLTGVCDTQEARARNFHSIYNVPYFTDLHEMMTKIDVDVVSVLTPSGTHASNVIQLAPYGKHVVVEKPMALTLDDAEAMISACDHHSVRLFVVKQNRFNLPVVKLREAVTEGRFGKLILGTVRVRWCREQTYYDQDAWRGTWAQDGGVLANQASHHLDLLEWMMGDVESVFAMSTRALARIEAEDTAVVVLKFSNGALGTIEATTATRPKDLEGSISILGEKGTVEIGGFAVNEMKVWSFTEKRPEDEAIFKDYSVNPPDIYGFGHREYYKHVAECIGRNAPMLVDGLEGRRSLELITAIYESIETKNEVFMRFRPRFCRLGQAAEGPAARPKKVDVSQNIQGS
jgi:UDP-N-acetyl-2-amino-2-deoxyglucuronate dehydrogenase